MANEETQFQGEEELEFDDIQEEPEQETVDWKATALRYKKKLSKVKESKAPVQQDNSASETRLARMELKLEGYTDEAIDFAMKLGGREALQDPHVKAAINSIQEQKRAEQAVIADESAKSDIERKMSPEEIEAMSPEELYKVLPKARK